METNDTARTPELTRRHQGRRCGYSSITGTRTCRSRRPRCTGSSRGGSARRTSFSTRARCARACEFLEEITSRLSGTAGAFLALIGPEWLPTMDAHRRRGDHDYVAQEIDLGMRNGWTVIPVLLNDAPLPEGRDLPLAIKALPRHHVARLRQTSLDADIEDLIARLDEIGSARPGRRGRARRRRSRDREVRVDPGDGRVRPSPDVPAADDEHYQMLADEADNLVIFLGAGANADDREGPFRPGSLDAARRRRHRRVPRRQGQAEVFGSGIWPRSRSTPG